MTAFRARRCAIKGFDVDFGEHGLRVAWSWAYCLRRMWAICAEIRLLRQGKQNVRSRPKVSGRQTLLAEVVYPPDCPVNVVGCALQGAGTQRNQAFATIGRV